MLCRRFGDCHRDGARRTSSRLRRSLEMPPAMTTAAFVIDPSVVRGLEYYTGAVFEAELLAEIPNEKGQPVVFGSVGGGGRYDGLVGRFLKEDVPATGFSIGVSRLQAALAALGKLDTSAAAGPVVVTVMDRDRIGDYQRMVSALRNADIAAELYLGSSGMRAQLKYADRRNAPAVVIQGGDEKARGVVQIKDLALGKQPRRGHRRQRGMARGAARPVRGRPRANWSRGSGRSSPVRRLTRPWPSATASVVVTVMDRERVGDYQKLGHRAP